MILPCYPTDCQPGRKWMPDPIVFQYRDITVRFVRGISGTARTAAPRCENSFASFERLFRLDNGVSVLENPALKPTPNDKYPIVEN
jgi:hypothetical protein